MKDEVLSQTSVSQIESYVDKTEETDILNEDVSTSTEPSLPAPTHTKNPDYQPMKEHTSTGSYLVLTPEVDEQLVSKEDIAPDVYIAARKMNMGLYLRTLDGELAGKYQIIGS